jgi:5'-nucleotidase/UDP-sugar diphosphatase
MGPSRGGECHDRACYLAVNDVPRTVPVLRIPTRSIVLAALLISTVSLQPAWAEATKITLLLMCDMYNLGPKEGRGGYPKVAGVIAEERARGGHVFVAHAGDAYSPTLLSSFDRAEHVVELLNTIRPDVFVPGNHEYDFGPEIFRKRVADSRFPVLAANLREAGGQPVANIGSTKLVQFGDIKIGVVGLTAEDSPKKSVPGDLAFSPVVETLKQQAAALRASGADLVVAVAHSDRGIDQQIIESRAADILLSGDDHDLWLQYDGKTAAVEAMQDGDYVVAIDLAVNVDRSGGKRAVSWWPGFRVIDTATAAPDPKVAALVEGYEATLSKELDVSLGRTETELDSRNAAVRAGEAAIGNLYADAIRAATNADIALLNGGGFRANKIYPAGSDITRRDVLRELPFSNKTVLLEVTGAQLRKAVEHGLSNLREPTGRFPQVAGMRIEADRSKPVGQRVTALLVNGRQVTETDVFKLATNDFLMRGGDGYDALAEARALSGERDGKLIANDVMVYIRAKGTVSAKPEGRVQIR